MGLGLLMPFLIALRAFGGSVLGFLGKLNPYQLALIALGLFALVQHFELAHARRQAVNYSRQLERCTSARHADQLAYTEGQREAQLTNNAHVAKIEQQYQRNSDNEHQSYLSDRAKLIAYYDGLRAQRKAAPGSPNPANPSAPNTAPGGTNGNGLQVSPADDLQTRQDAAEIELRLMHLQEYVAGVLAIDPNAH